MENYFKPFRENTIGHNFHFQTPFGMKKMVYADWVASGRLYKPIEIRMIDVFGPFIGNTHTETSETGTLMTKAYQFAHAKIKKHVNASPNDCIITTGFGMTSAINKLQRILGLKFCGKLFKKKCLQESELPVVFLTHMEHHSNHTSWFETIADIVQINPDKKLLVDLNHLDDQLKKYKNRKIKIGSFTACSNVTGIIPPYHQMAKIMHEHGGVCFIDFAASAPYVDMNMHPADHMERLDAIFFSPHKFLGGPGASGVLVFNTVLYDCPSPDQPGGGTVDWTNPWGEYKYVDSIEAREDGGTPGFLQAIKTALCIDLKEQMGTGQMQKREEQLVDAAFRELEKIPGLHLLAPDMKERLGIISFYLDNIHYNLVTKMLSDRFGIQVRGGCACAGTYGHYLLNVSYNDSKKITDLINHGDFSLKPGWIRLSLHPTMTDQELALITHAVREISLNAGAWEKDYVYNKHTNEFRNVAEPEDRTSQVQSWFRVGSG